MNAAAQLPPPRAPVAPIDDTGVGAEVLEALSKAAGFDCSGFLEKKMQPVEAQELGRAVDPMFFCTRSGQPSTRDVSRGLDETVAAGAPIAVPPKTPSVSELRRRGRVTATTAYTSIYATTLHCLPCD
jgi:hypothetical protein